MSGFASRISAGTLLAAAVAWMLTLPLVFPSGRESGVAALPALQGLPDLRIVAPGARCALLRGCAALVRGCAARGRSWTLARSDAGPATGRAAARAPARRT